MYRNSQGIFIAQKLADAGEEVAFLDPNHFGVKFVANSVVTSRRMLQNEPATVKRFIHALLAGWEAALDPANTARALDTLQQFDRDTPRERLAEQLDITRTLIKPTAALKIGTIDTAAWKQTEQIMLTQKQIGKPVQVETVLHPEIAF